MKVNYEYASPSICSMEDNQTTLGLSPDHSRSELVSFLGRLKHPLVFRDAMLMLREIVVSDTRTTKKERVEFFDWLDLEIERRVVLYDQYAPQLRSSLSKNIDATLNELGQKDEEIAKLLEIKSSLQKEIDASDVWKDYNKLERSFWQYIKNKDLDLWFVLDPVITVHKDQVTFEAFSLDESIYGILSIDMSEFELLAPPQLGTTNIDFSYKLAKEIERFRTYNEVILSVNPNGFAVEQGTLPSHLEKKIDLPETWIKGFNQVSAAASLDGLELELSPVDFYDICSFLRRYKAHKSPRYMKWILTPQKPIEIVFEPFGTSLILQTIYTGSTKREEKIWGRRRFLVTEKLIPLAKSFKVKLLGFGMPHFITADLGTMKLTIGLSSWSSNDWVKGTAFNIMAGFIGEGNYPKIYELLKEERALSFEKAYELMSKDTKVTTKAGIGHLFKRGEGYFDLSNHSIRFRELYNMPLPPSLYQTTDLETQVQNHINEGMDQFTVETDENKLYTFTHHLHMPNEKYLHWSFRNTPDYHKEFILTDTILSINNDGEICSLNCTCKSFKKGPRNISAPCAHILALYIASSKFLRVNLEPHKVYKINDIMEILL